MDIRTDYDGIDQFRDDLIKLLRKHQVTVSRSPHCKLWYFENPITDENLSMNEIKHELSLSRR